MRGASVLKTRAELIQQISHLRDVGRGGRGITEAEAISARSLARTLMREHGISSAEVGPTSAPHGHYEIPKPANAPRRKPIRGRVKFGAFEIRFEL